jgi:hypothetical protein
MATAKSSRRLTRPTGAMAGWAEAKKNPTILLGDMQKHVLARSLEDTAARDQLHIHPSEMCKDDWCPRQTFKRIKHYRDGGATLDSGRAYSFQMQTIFQEGHDVHHKFQTWLAEMGRLHGTWINVVEGETRHDHTLSAEDFATGEWRYREVPLKSESHLIIGHADGAVLDVGALVEVKTIGMGTLRMEVPTWLNRFLVTTEDGRTIYDLDDAWKNLKRPLNPHIKQTNIYGFLAKEQGLAVDKVVFIYEYKANQGVKEFSVKFNQDLVQDLLDMAFDIKTRLDNGDEQPPKPEHAAKDARVCKECPFFKDCWESKDADSDQSTGSRRNTSPGRVKPGGKAQTRTPGAARSGQARSASTGTARGTDGDVGLRTDVAVQPTDGVDELPRSATGSSGGGRKIRRRHPRKAQGVRSSGEQDREDGHGSEGEGV